MGKFQKVLSPITINKTEFKNRLWIPPMGTSAVEPDGTATEEMVAYFGNMAKGGAGAVVLEVADVDEHRRYNSTVLGLFDDKFMPKYKEMIDAIHDGGSKAISQLLHAGPIPLIKNDPTQYGPLCASSVPHIYNLNAIPQVITKEQMGEIKQMFVDAALRVVRAGIDGIEIHCAHNHGLLGTFVSPIHNKRTDEYGGNLTCRIKYPLEVIEAVRKAVGPDMVLGVRISSAYDEVDGITLEDSCRMAKMFEKAGINYIHVSNGSLITIANIQPPHGSSQGLFANRAKAIKESVNIPVGTIGRITDPEIAEELLETGAADIIFMGRALIADPELPNKIKEGREEDIRPCIGCNECVTAAMYGNGFYCAMNTLSGHELEGKIVCDENNKGKKVLVIGGGPGGLEAAKQAAIAGYDVTLVEKANYLGGQFELAAYPPTKQEFTCGVKYLINQVEKHGVDIRLNTEATKELVIDMKPDAVIVATGGKPIEAKWITESGHSNVIGAWDAIKGSANIGTNIVVIGGGLVGCECADMIAAPRYYRKQYARKVTVIEMQDYVMAGDFTPQRDQLMVRLMDKNVDILEGAKVKEISADSITYVKDDETKTIKHVDTIISAVGTQSVNSLSEELKDLNVPVITIGDALAPRKIHLATREAADAIKNLKI